MDSTLKFATNLAQETGKLLLDRFTVKGVPSQLKPDRSLVTQADMDADRFITEAIQERYPQDGLLSEELFPTMQEAQNAVWVIDPLDGTTNYSLGLPFWGVSIARLVEGLPDVAAVYFPPLGEMYTAQKGSGAFLNRMSIHARRPAAVETASFFSSCSRTYRRYEVRLPYKPRIFGSAAYSLCSVGRGISLLAFVATAKIWDLAGGWLVVKEAGGVVGVLQGSEPLPLQSYKDYRQESFPILAASTQELFAQGLSQILPRSSTLEAFPRTK